MWVSNGGDKSRYEAAKDWYYETIEYNKPKTLKELCLELTELNAEEITLREVIEYSLPYIFDEVFPIFDEKHRAVLERKIVQHYFFRQLCCVDPEEWKLRLNTKMNEIMPYYNKMYESYQYLVDIMDDVDYERNIDEQNASQSKEKTNSTIESDSTGKVESTSASTGNMETTSDEGVVNKVGYSDTPQGALSGVDTNTYLTTYQKTTNDTDKTQKSTSDTASNDFTKNQNESSTDTTIDSQRDNAGVVNRKERVKGKMYANTKSKMVMEYRKAIINIDLDIIKDLRPLFLNIYN